MKSTSYILHQFFLSILSFVIIIFSSNIVGYAQTASYSTKAQGFLNTYSADNLDVFKFSINDILNSQGDNVENSNGDPTIFGRTDYGSEFFLENELDTTSSIEIPAFVIDDLAENEMGNYFPVLKNGAINLFVDFKDLYDTKNGQAITPEMGFVKLLEPEGTGQYTNLIDGDTIEFIVRPTAPYLENHGASADLFFIDRPIPEEPVVSEINADETEYTATDDNSSSETVTTVYVGPGEEAVALPGGEIKVYVTSVYVKAPASKFQPSQVVMPVNSDGDFNYDVEPAAAETFPDEIQVVAIPEEKAREISEKVKAIKKEKEAPTNQKNDDDIPPAFDPGIEASLKLNIFLNDVQKGPAKLLSETKKIIQKEFPNISEELINLIINLANPNEKFDLIQNPKKFLDNEFAKLSDPTELNLLLGGDLPQKDLTKIYNLILYKLSSDLAGLGFDTLRNQKIDFSVNIKNADQILEQVQLQLDILAMASLLGFDEGSENLSSLLIEPVKTNPESSATLFDSSKSQKIFSQINTFSKLIKLINSPPIILSESEGFPINDIPIVELNVGVGENIAEALEEKLARDKILNREFQPQSQNSILEKFSFDIPPQNESSTPITSPPLLAYAPNITDQEIQLVSETTEATNNILDETVAKMLKELGEETPDENTAQFVAETGNLSPIDQQEPATRQIVVFSNALSTAQRLQEVEDIRAIFEILGIGS